MSLNIGDNFKYLGKKFLDSRESFATLELMKNCVTVPDGFITYCEENGKRYEFNSSNTIDELTGKWIEYFSGAGDCAYVGIEEPDESKIWFINSTQQASVGMSYDNPIIAELFNCIQSLQAQITQLQADVEYLKLNGGGGIPSEPDDPSIPPEIEEEVYLTLEDGGLFELEEGGFVILEETIQVSKDPSLILEDGSMFLLEDGSFILLEEAIVAVKDNIMLLESGAELLLENNFNILME